MSPAATDYVTRGDGLCHPAATDYVTPRRSPRGPEKRLFTGSRGLRRGMTVIFIKFVAQRAETVVISKRADLWITYHENVFTNELMRARRFDGLRWW